MYSVALHATKPLWPIWLQIFDEQTTTVPRVMNDPSLTPLPPEPQCAAAMILN